MTFEMMNQWTARAMEVLPAMNPAGISMRVRRRFWTALALLGFVLVAAGAAHVNQSRAARIAASERAEATAQLWLRGVVVELDPAAGESWEQESGRESLMILEAICPTEKAR
jgi:hypothetical protein